MFVLSAIIFAAPYAIAGTKQGAKEIQAQGTFIHRSNSNDDNTTLTLVGQLSANYFLRNNISVGGTVQIDRTVFDMGSVDQTRSTISLLPGIDYYFGTPTSVIVPYVGARLGIVSYTSESFGRDDSGTTFSINCHGGAKYFISENFSWNAALDLTVYDTEDDTVTDLSVLIGASYYF